ncbi:hypothetical protein ACHAWF_008146 [Thalassiosira exigua]
MKAVAVAAVLGVFACHDASVDALKPAVRGAEQKALEDSPGAFKDSPAPLDVDASVKNGDSMSDEEYGKLHGLTVTSTGESLCSECPAHRAHHLPFFMTNTEGAHNGDELRISYHSDRTPVDVYYLRDVTFCESGGWSSPWVVTGTKISAGEFKAAIKSHLEDNDLSAVLFRMHGVATAADRAFNLYGRKWQENYQEVTRVLPIPITWRNVWSSSLMYEFNRNTLAIRAGKMFADHPEVFKQSDYISYLHVDSMGNWVLRNWAQSIASPEKLFDKIFMVCADERSDMFADNYNPAAPRTEEELFLQGEKGGSPSFIQDSTEEAEMKTQDSYSPEGYQNIFTCTYNQSPQDKEGIKLREGEGVGIPVEDLVEDGISWYHQQANNHAYGVAMAAAQIYVADLVTGLVEVCHEQEVPCEAAGCETPYERYGLNLIYGPPDECDDDDLPPGQTTIPVNCCRLERETDVPEPQALIGSNKYRLFRHRPLRAASVACSRLKKRASAGLVESVYAEFLAELPQHVHHLPSLLIPGMSAPLVAMCRSVPSHRLPNALFHRMILRKLRLPLFDLAAPPRCWCGKWHDPYGDHIFQCVANNKKMPHNFICDGQVQHMQPLLVTAGYN